MPLTKTAVGKIKADIRLGMKQEDIAKKYGVTRGAISDIATERRHKNVPWPDQDPQEARILELEAEVEHLVTERNEARKRVKSEARERGLFNAVVTEIEKGIVPVKALPPKQYPKRAGITEHCVMHLSDGHHDQLVTREESGGLEYHDFNVACRRAERYVDTVIQWTQHTLAPRFHFPVLWVLAYGDHTSGEIHDSVPRSAFKNQNDNCLAIGRLHASMLRDLAPYFPQIKVVYLSGNHGRRSIKKDYHGANNNWDYMIGRVAELHCKNLTNVEFLIPNAWSVNLDINGVGFNVFHGDDIGGSLGIPYYGLQRRQRSLTALQYRQEGPRTRYYCCGHFHKPGSVGDLDGEILVNGPWVGTDAYAYNKFGGYTEPSQWLHGVHPEHGITWRMNVLLRSEDEQQQGRYAA